MDHNKEPKKVVESVGKNEAEKKRVSKDKTQLKV